MRLTLLLHQPLLGKNVILRFVLLRQCLTLSFTGVNMLFISWALVSDCEKMKTFTRFVVWGISQKTQVFPCGRFGYSSYGVTSKMLQSKSTKVFIVAGVLREGILYLILMQWRHRSSKDLKLNECWWVVSFGLRPIYPSEIKLCVSIQNQQATFLRQRIPACHVCNAVCGAGVLDVDRSGAWEVLVVFEGSCSDNSQ